MDFFSVLGDFSSIITIVGCFAAGYSYLRRQRIASLTNKSNSNSYAIHVDNPVAMYPPQTNNQIQEDLQDTQPVPQIQFEPIPAYPVIHSPPVIVPSAMQINTNTVSANSQGVGIQGITIIGIVSQFLVVLFAIIAGVHDGQPNFAEDPANYLSLYIVFFAYFCLNIGGITYVLIKTASSKRFGWFWGVLIGSICGVMLFSPILLIVYGLWNIEKEEPSLQAISASLQRRPLFIFGGLISQILVILWIIGSSLKDANNNYYDNEYIWIGIFVVAAFVLSFFLSVSLLVYLLIIIRKNNRIGWFVGMIIGTLLCFFLIPAIPLFAFGLWFPTVNSSPKTNLPQ